MRNTIASRVAGAAGALVLFASAATAESISLTCPQAAGFELASIELAPIVPFAEPSGEGTIDPDEAFGKDAMVCTPRLMADRRNIVAPKPFSSPVQPASAKFAAACAAPLDDEG